MLISQFCDKLIHWSFYTLLFFVPLFFTSNTSELFELNKMWLTWGLTVIIIGSWIIKMTVQREFVIQRTPLDIPILLFLLSQLISTIFSLDSRMSFWGYYSRFNGGFLSLLSYTLLYYAFVSNTTLVRAKKYFLVTVLGAIFVALWGWPSHFGYDPTCLLFRGTLDTSCWTDAFKPTIRIFSSLGQPAWMAAYLAVLLPMTMALTLWRIEKNNIKNLTDAVKNYKIVGLVILSLLFYFDLIYTDTRGGFMAFWAANGIFWLTILVLRLFPLKKLFIYAALFNILFLCVNFISGSPIPQLERLSLKSLISHSNPAPATVPGEASPVTPTPSPRPAGQGLLDTGITDSGDIRLLVWKGALDAWKAHPIFGTGVETFAFAYYQHRPQQHNMTSEWDYLYNKAHNEYLNYLTTTGIVGLGTHLLLLAGFLIFAALRIRKVKSERKELRLEEGVFYAAALPAAFISIIISNFFGFSVVIINIFLYFLPAWFFIFNGMLNPEKNYHYSFSTPAKHAQNRLNSYQWTVLVGVILIGGIFIFQLIRFWQADVAYALGMNLDRAGEYQAAYPNLAEAVKIRQAEPTFKDELSTNLGTLAIAFAQNNNATTAGELAQQAIALSDDVVMHHPNNVVFWKSRVRVFYALGQVDPHYFPKALEGILHAKKLAPTDAKISYNVAIMYGQNNQFENAVKELDNTLRMKPNYRDAYYARGIFYHQLSENATEFAKKSDYQNKAIADLTFQYENFSHDTEAKKMLDEWGIKVK